MSWEFAADRPIYSQLVERISIDIINGNYPVGARLPSVRELASQAKVNPNTMQRALAELETMGLVFAERTSGRFVTEDHHLIQTTKQTLAYERIQKFFTTMADLGINKTSALELAANHQGKEYQ
jgi:DNA-binding transcriptional regulator YhcF (GntR family)